MSEERRRDSIRRELSSMAPGPRRDFLPTGFASLDAALGGGLPRGRISEFFGPAGCGKSTLALQMAARAQGRGEAAGWIDAEHSFDPRYAASLALDLERLPLARPDSAEQGLDIAARLADTDALDLLVIDSAAALVPQMELEAGVGETGPGLHARVLANGLRRLSHLLARRRTCLLFLNQARTRRDAEGRLVETTAGGAALKLHAALRVSLGRAAHNRLRLRILKNKAGEGAGACEIGWQPGVGFVETP
jgi:recombination protein RecA